jgi:hypothetical protein
MKVRQYLKRFAGKPEGTDQFESLCKNKRVILDA